MNERQRRFADEYIKTGNATQAAIKAGYSEKTANRIASQNLSKSDIKSYIDEQMQELHKQNIMDAAEALSILSEIARGKREEEVLMLNPITGEVIKTTKKPDNSTVIRAAGEILKRYPTAKQSEKLELEIKKLKAQFNDSSSGSENIVIVDSWEEVEDDI